MIKARWQMSYSWNLIHKGRCFNKVNAAFLVFFLISFFKRFECKLLYRHKILFTLNRQNLSLKLAEIRRINMFIKA